MAKAAKPGTAKPAPKKGSMVKAGNGAEAAVKAVAASPVLSAPEPAPGSKPGMRILGQYLKDLSFENPNAPASLAPQTKQPDINISVNVNARNLAPNDFEVELQLDAKASGDGKVIFAAELKYAGIFRSRISPRTCSTRLC